MYNFAQQQPNGMQENTFTIQKTARYFTIGNWEKARYLLICLHGYGQLPAFFGRKFEAVDQDYFVVIPEGLHRFYLEGSSGRVGASWMTKEARQQDIDDNTNYLTKLVNSITQNKSFEKIILMGFSQGGATAARFYYQHQKIDHLVLWACIFPPDLHIEDEINGEPNKNFFVLGSEDPYFNETEQKNTIDFYRNMNFYIVQYAGNHTIEISVLNNLLNNLK
jgi:predicted esterase